MIPEIRSEALQRGITRLCHFTPSRNLAHIARGEAGILSTAKLEEDERRLFNPTDLQRWDGRKTHISCSIEYPNAWYFDVAAGKDRLFRDWVIPALKPDPLWADGTLFSPQNASKNGGAGLEPGYAGFQRLYARQVGNYRRQAARSPACPTDEQAEVMVQDQIPMELIRAVIMRDAGQAKREALRLELMGIDPAMFNWMVAPELFEKHQLSSYIQSGRRPVEEPWAP